MEMVEFLSGEEANKLSAEMGAVNFQPMEGTADIWVDKNKAIIFLHLLQHQKGNIPIQYPVSKNTQSGNNIRQKNLRKPMRNWSLIRITPSIQGIFRRIDPGQ